MAVKTRLSLLYTLCSFERYITRGTAVNYFVRQFDETALLSPILHEHALLLEHGRERLEENLHVQREAQGAHILNVHLQAVVPGERVAAVDGGVAGDAGLYGELQPFVALVELGLAAQVGAGAHHAHVALQHVQELGHLVEARLAHEGAHAGHAGVVSAVVGGAVLHDQVGGVHAHGAQLVHLEVAAAKPHARGVVEDRALVLEVDERCQHRDDQQHEGQRHQPYDDVAHAFSETHVHQRTPSASSPSRARLNDPAT